jgi:hypothetical protein
MATGTEDIAKTSTLNAGRRLVCHGVLRLRCDEARRVFFGDSSERRARRRIHMRRVAYITPVIMEGATLRRVKTGSDSSVAYTTDVSINGMGFTHDEPLATRHAIVTFDLLDDEPVSLVIEIKWSHCRAHRWYCSGGKFIGVTETPNSLCYVPNRPTAIFN